jgi:hypothetical protein
MFGFLNRNKSAVPNDMSKSLSDSKDANQKNGTFSAQDEIEDAKKNLYESIVLKRTDILVSIMNEWFKSKYSCLTKRVKSNFNFKSDQFFFKSTKMQRRV